MRYRGQSLIELLIAIAVTSLFIPTLLTSVVASREGKTQQSQRLQAITLLTEAQEALRSVRERGWGNVSQNGTFHPVVSGSLWSLASGEEAVGGFTRSIVISDVYRDASGAIVVSSGLLDPSTKRAVIAVSWGTPFPSSVDSTVFLTRYLGNTTTVQTTQPEFNAGTKTNVIVTNTAGGEVQISQTGRADWCAPNLSIAALNLPRQGVANAVTAIEGRAFAATGENASGESFANISLSNTNPPVASILGTFSNYKTNDVFGEQDFGYIATDTNSKEVIILDIRQTPYSEIGYFDSPGPTDATSVFILNNTGYMTAGNKLYNFSLTQDSGNRTGPRPALDPDGVTLAGTGTAVYVVGNYAYVATGSSATQLQIVDVSNQANLTIVSQAGLLGLGARDVFVKADGTRAYLVTDVSSAQREFFIVDTFAKTGNRPTLGSFDTGDDVSPRAVEVVTNNRAIIVGREAEDEPAEPEDEGEYQVLNIANELQPTRCGGMEVNTGINDSASVVEADGDAYSYIVTGDASAEFKIIEGGPGGSFPTTGTFESATIDVGNEVAFNRFVASVVKPLATDIQFQVAISDAVSGSCSNVTFTFLGPDGTANTKYPSSGGAVFLNKDGVLYENPGRCLRYKAFFTTSDPLVTPILSDITFSYSP